MTKRSQTAFAAAIALAAALSACSGPKGANHSLYSTAQPVVEHHDMTLDVATGYEGLPVSEQRRLNDWFDTLDLRYGDRIALDGQGANRAAYRDVSAIAGRYGMLLSDGAAVTSGVIAPGMVRVVVTRSRAYVPNCPNWGHQYASTVFNNTADGYGCAVNSNFAAMVADPDHLLHGAEGTGETVVMSASKAIKTYREQDPTGKAGLPKVSSQSGSGGN